MPRKTIELFDAVTKKGLLEQIHSETRLYCLNEAVIGNNDWNTIISCHQYFGWTLGSIIVEINYQRFSIILSLSSTYSKCPDQYMSKYIFSLIFKFCYIIDLE